MTEPNATIAEPPGVRITFKKTSSRRYREAVRLAKSFSGYEALEEEGVPSHSLKMALPVGDVSLWRQLRKLIGIISGWSTTEIVVCNKPLSHSWDFDREMDSLVHCYDRRPNSPALADYCQGKNGPQEDMRHLCCRHESGVFLPSDYWERRVRWYQFGTLSDDNTLFRVDKPAILAALKRGTEGTLFVNCPLFDWSRATESISRLPDQLVIGGDSGFSLRYSKLNPEMPVGVQREDEGQRGLSLSIAIGGTKDRILGKDGGEPRNVPSVTFDDIAGQGQAVAQVRDLIELPLLYPDHFKAIGVAPHKGLLLYGPPGNGKTLIAKAVASQCNAHLEVINGPEILSKWVGQSEANLRRIFDRANDLAPSVILIDEVDAIAGPRRDTDAHHEVSLISQLLVLLDGLRERKQVVVIGTTNRIEAIDSAILRPGRLDYKIEIPKPDLDGRREMFSVNLRKMKIVNDVKPEELAAKTEGSSGADIAAICREAGLFAVKRAIAAKRPAEDCIVTMADFENALLKLEA